MGFKITNNKINNSQNVYFIGEVGINHNGDIDLAKKIILEAKKAGFSAVKFQKRNPEVSTPDDMKSRLRETPWGEMTYLDYKFRIEFEKKDYDEIHNYCRHLEIDWFASCWDIDSLNFLLNYEPPVLKIASASITNKNLLIAHRDSSLPIIMSTGMSTSEEIHKAHNILNENELAILHTTSTYPCPPEELNLNVIKTLIQKYPNNPIGYSGHESGLSTSIAAAVLGAKIIERHITTNRAMWGTDQAASLEPIGMQRLVGSVNKIITALGDGEKKVYESEIPIKAKLRNVNTI
jgi:N-acetylneuraminate synthase